MPDFRVDSVYNLTAIEEEQAKFLAFLAQSKAAILDLNNQRVVVKSSEVSTFTQASENLNKSVSASNTALKNITATSTEYNRQLALSAKASKDAAQAKLIEAKAILEQEKADATRTKSLILQEKELERLIKLEEKRNAAIPKNPIDMGSRNVDDQLNSKNGIAFSAEAKAAQDAEVEATLESISAHDKLKESLLTEDQIRQRAIESQRKSAQALREFELANSGAKKETDELSKARLALAKANSVENVQLQGLNAQRSLANKAAKEESLTTLGLIGPYKLLEKEYAAAALNAKDLAVQYGINSVEAKAAAAQALALNTQLQAIDKTVGQSQKNVGNYGSAFTKGLSGAWSAVRKLAYLIPGVGIAGLLSFAIDPIMKWIKAVKEATGDAKILQDTLKEGAKGASSQVAELEILREKLTDLNKPQAERITLAKEYNKTAKEGNKIDLEQIDNLKLINDQILKQIDLIEKQSLAKAAQAQVAVFAEREIQAQFKLQEALEQTGLTEDQVAKSIEARSKTTEKQLDNTRKSLDNFNQKAIIKPLIKESDVNQAQVVDKKIELLLLNKQKAAYELDRVIKLLLPSLTDGIPDPEKTKNGKGGDSLQELKDRLNTEFDIYKIAQEAKIRLFQNEIKGESTYYTEKLTAFDNYLKAQKELLDREEQHEIELAEAATRREKHHLEEQRTGKSDAEKARIDENIAINQKNLEQQILLIKAKYADEGNKLIEGAAETRNKIVEDHLKIEKELYEQYSKDLQDNIDKDNDRIQKGFEERKKMEEAAAKERIQLLQDLHAKEVELATQSGNLLFAIATAGYENQLNLLTKQSEDIEKRKDAELAANDALVQSTQDKAANVILINSRAQAQQDVLDRKAAAIKTKEAQFERAQQIFEIGVNTIKTIAAIKLAIAEETIKAIANPLLTPLIGLIAAQIPVALASSALSIGAILATPLPRYKHGRGEKGEEFAIVGDGGVNEYIMRGTGQIEKTPAVNTLTHLMPKDKVYPNKESLMRELIFNNMQLSDYSVSKDGGINRNDIERLGNRLEDSISGIRIQTQLVTKSGWRNHNERLAKYDAWVDRVIKN